MVIYSWEIRLQVLEIGTNTKHVGQDTRSVPRPRSPQLCLPDHPLDLTEHSGWLFRTGEVWSTWRDEGCTGTLKKSKEPALISFPSLRCSELLANPTRVQG